MRRPLAVASVVDGRYLFDELLGGTAATVHRAHDLLLQRDVAIKSFPGTDGAERWQRDAVLRERLGVGQAAEVLDGAPDSDQGPFVVMPLARSGSLDRAAHPWEPSVATLLVARLAPGLGRLHRLGAVHGAVSGDGVLLDPRHGPRWAGHGGAPPPDATGDDDVVALARVATAVVTGLPEPAAEPSPAVVDALRALVRGAPDLPATVHASGRLRAGLGRARRPRREVRHRRTGELEGRVSPARRRVRSRSTAVAACAAAVLFGGVFGIGTKVSGGLGGPGAAAGDLRGPTSAPVAVGPAWPAAPSGVVVRPVAARVPSPAEGPLSRDAGSSGTAGSGRDRGVEAGSHTVDRADAEQAEEHDGSGTALGALPASDRTGGTGRHERGTGAGHHRSADPSDRGSRGVSRADSGNGAGSSTGASVSDLGRGDSGGTSDGGPGGVAGGGRSAA